MFWLNDLYTWSWVGWVLYFAIVEGAALFREKRVPGEPDTLSEHIWAWLGFGSTVGRHVGIRRILAVCLWSVLTAHFFFRFV